MFQVRKMKPEDLGFVMGLVEEAGMELGKLLSNLDGFLICENNHVSCGCGCLATDGSLGYLYWLAVSEEQRRSGLGSAIVKALLNIADHKGIKEVYTPGGCSTFLKALGFEETSPNTCCEKARAVLGFTENCIIYKVSMEGYFKPCSAK